MLVLSALPVIFPRNFQYLEKRISKICCLLALAVLCVSVVDDINASKQAKAQAQKFEKRIATAEEAAKPIPLNIRLRSLLQEIDSKIIPAIKAGRYQFEGGITASQFHRLQTLAKEEGGSDLIFIDPSSVRMGIGMGAEGVTYNVAFKVTPRILNE